MVGQQQESVIYTFDGCDGSNSGTLDTMATIEGNPGCECGVIVNALELDGNNDRVSIPDTVGSLFDDDFTVSFYFQASNTSNTTDIFSYRTSCEIDSTFSVKYIPVSNSVRVEIAENFNNIIDLQGSLSSSCWHHITVTKFNLQYSLFIDGQLVDQVLARRRIPYGKNAKLWIANSPCLAFTEDRIIGKIDEFEIKNYALSLTEVSSAYVSPDRILTPDTTIFLGEQVQILTGPSCAQLISWSPTADLDAGDIPDPVATGNITTEYVVSFADINCSSMDTILINVVDPEALLCGDLLLPKAFTPNDDNLNDVYRISNAFIVQDLISFEIFDRIGEKVYSGSDKRMGWDGSYKGQMVNPGMYLYKIKYVCDNQEYIKLDNFTVLR